MEKKTEQKKGMIERILPSCMLVLGILSASKVFGSYYYGWTKTLSNDPAFLHCLDYLGHTVQLLTYLVYGYFVKQDRKYMIDGFRGKPSRNLRNLLLGAAGGLLMMGICIFAAVQSGTLVLHPVRDGNILLFLFAVVCVFIQSSTEELEARGYLQGKLNAEGLPFWAVVLAVGVFFSFSHAGNTGIGFLPYLNIFLIGSLFAITVKITGSVWFACGAHTAWNFAQDFLFGLPDSGHPAVFSAFSTEVKSGGFFFDPVFGIEGSVMATLVTIAALVIAYLIGKKIKGDAFLKECASGEGKKK